MTSSPSTTGTTVTDGGVTFGTFDNVVVRNTSDIPQRDYQGLQFIVNYRPANDWAVGGHWTVQIKNEGNFEGEAANQPGSYSIIGDRPEFYSAARHYPFADHGPAVGAQPRLRPSADDADAVFMKKGGAVRSAPSFF